MTQVVPGVTAAPEKRVADRLGRRQYAIGVGISLLVAFVFRTWFGARGSFTGDDWTFREAMAQPLSLGRIFEGHNGHLNPLGLFLEWLVQQMFPGRYVPLMTVSALLVVASAAVAAWWFATVFGRRWAGIAVAVVTASSPMLLELITWWSVALYAAPMVLTTWLAVAATTQYARGRLRLVWPVLAYVGCLLSSSKALLVPLILVGLLAGLALNRPAPPGFRQAIVMHRRLWAWLAGITAVYFGIFLLRRGDVVTGSAGPAEIFDFLLSVWRVGFFPAAWGGPWAWFSFGFHNSPAPLPIVITATTVATLALFAVLLLIRPRVWPVMLTCLAYMCASITLVAIGRAGGMWSAPNLRYTFDLLLPLTLIVVCGLFTTRWEVGGRSQLGQRLARWPGWRPAGAVLTGLWVVAVAASMLTPWRTLPNNPMAAWITSVRASYPYLGNGLLPQSAPPEVTAFAEPLDRFLAGDPGKPALVQWVPDRAFGFDGQGRLIDKVVQGVQAVAPLGQCSYQATKTQAAYVPLMAALPPGEHTVALDVSLNVESPVSVQLGSTAPTTMRMPAGARRAYAVVEGPGGQLVLTVAEPNASLCVTGAVVGVLVDGPVVDPASLPQPGTTGG